MLILHPDSSCDVCLERYGGRTLPNVIVCGHSFCQRCLLSISPQCCPLCRAPFAYEHIRRLHFDRGNSSPSSQSDDMDVMDEAPQARQYFEIIMRIINSGGTTDQVTEFIREVHEWLDGQHPDAHPVLRAAHILLYKYWDKKSVLIRVERTRDELKERLREENELAEERYQELKRTSAVELETAKAVEKSLRDHLESMENEWNGKYEVCVAECRALSEELQELKQQRQQPDTPPHTPESSSWLHAGDTIRSEQNSLRIVDEDAADDGEYDKEFHLSPVSRTRPIPSLPSASFRGISYESDRDDEGSRSIYHKPSHAYALRSIPPVNPSLHRMRSNSSSLLSRPEHEAVSRSLPKSSVDVHMTSCSPSPSASRSPYAPRDRSGDTHPASCKVNEGILGLRIGDSAASTEPDEEQHERWRDQLHDVLDNPRSAPAKVARRKTVSGSDNARRIHSSGSTSATRNPSPLSSSPPGSTYGSVSTSPSAAAPPTPSSAAPLQRPHLISRASEAAIQAERARASVTNSASTSPVTMVHSIPRDREMSYPHPQTHAPPRQTTPRRVSSDSAKPKPATATATASNLTRTLWAMQEASRLGQPEPQRV